MLCNYADAAANDILKEIQEQLPKLVPYSYSIEIAVISSLGEAIPFLLLLDIKRWGDLLKVQVAL